MGGAGGAFFRSAPREPAANSEGCEGGLAVGRSVSCCKKSVSESGNGRWLNVAVSIFPGEKTP